MKNNKLWIEVIVNSNSTVNLHTSHKATITVVLIAIILLFGLNVVSIFTIEKGFAQFKSLLLSDYSYSATMNHELDTDDYICFDAGISFKLSEEAKTSINADVIMQSDSAHYTDKIYWNVKPLNAYEIAISSDIARENDLKVGDILFSKHVVDGIVREYQVAEIIRDASCVRIESTDTIKSFIIIGYDEQYVDNISHIHLIFTSEDVGSLYNYSNSTLANVVYREDEMISLIRIVLPYLVVLILSVASIIVVEEYYLNRNLSYNFKRLMILGFGKHELNVDYYKSIIGYSLLSISIVLIASVFLALIMKTTTVMCIYFVFLFVLEIITIIVSSNVFNKQLWRS